MEGSSAYIPPANTMSLSWQVALKPTSQTLPLKAGQTNEQPVSQAFGKHQPQNGDMTNSNQVIGHFLKYEVGVSMQCLF